MKKLIFISLIFLSSISFGQRKYLIRNNQIVQINIPKTFIREDGTQVYGYNKLSESVWYADGWRDEVVPEINKELQRYGQRYYNPAMDAVTWVVVDKTEGELLLEKEQKLDELDNSFDLAAMKKLLIELTKAILNSDSVTEEELHAISTIYPQFRADKDYQLNDVFVYDSVLYKVVQPHTSQADWLPDSTPALYTPYTPPGQISDWVQPTGAQDAYNIGDKVRFEGHIYESTINANVWSPVTYPAGWQFIQ